jgi:hypothetical protein
MDSNMVYPWYSRLGRTVTISSGTTAPFLSQVMLMESPNAWHVKLKSLSRLMFFVRGVMYALGLLCPPRINKENHIKDYKNISLSKTSKTCTDHKKP